MRKAASQTSIIVTLALLISATLFNALSPNNQPQAYATRSNTQNVTPILECVDYGRSQWVTKWGYNNPNNYAVTIPVGSNNSFSVTGNDVGQTTLFQPGRQTNVFMTTQGENTTLTWTLNGTSVTSGRNATVCPNNPTPTASATPSSTPQPTNTPNPTATPTPTPTNTPTPTSTQTPAPTNTPTPIPTSTPASTPESTASPTVQGTTPPASTGDGRSDGLGCSVNDCSGNRVGGSESVVLGVSETRSLPSTGSTNFVPSLIAVLVAATGFALRSYAKKQ